LIRLGAVAGKGFLREGLVSGGKGRETGKQWSTRKPERNGTGGESAW